MRKLFALFFIFLSHLNIHAKEPLIISDNFIKEQGEFTCISDGSIYRTDHYWTKNGKEISVHNRLFQRGLDIFAEYGLTCDDTLGVYVSWVQNKERLNWQRMGFSSPEFCWKHFLTSIDSFELSTRVIAIIPFTDEVTSVRYGKFGAEFDIHCKRNFILLDRDGWVEALAGYRYYQGFPSDLVKAYATVGYQLFSRLRLVGSAYLDYGLFNGHEEFKGPILTCPPRYRLLKTQEHAVFTITSFFEIFVGTYQHLWGEDIGTGVGYYTGISLDF